MLTLPDFNRLKTFHFVYRVGSIQKAAEKLHVTRSAVSQSIKALENEIGSKLFIRTNKTIIPTSQADILSQIITPFMKQLGETLNGFRKGKSEPFGIIKIGAPVQFGTNILVGEIAKFRRKYPNTQFHLVLGIPTKLLKKVSINELDFAFVDNADHFESQYPVTMENIWSEKFVLVSSRKYYKRKIDGDHSFKKIIGCNFISYVDHGPVIKMWFKHHFRKFPTDFSIILTVENVHGIINGVQSNLGLGVVPQYMIESRIKAGSMIKVISKNKELQNNLAIAQLPDKKPSLFEKTFISQVRHSFSNC